MPKRIRLEATGGWVGVLPPVEDIAPKRITRDTSNGRPDEARYLIALRTRNGIVVVRNCYDVPTSGGLYVENVGALVPRMTTKTSRSHQAILNRTLRRCLGRWKLHAGPWKIYEARPHFMCDLRVPDFDKAFAAACGVPQKRELRRKGKHGSTLKPVSPMEESLRLYRLSAGVFSGWTPARVKDIAGQWAITVEELAALCGCPRGLMEMFLEGGGLGALPESVQLWLFHLEQFIGYARYGREPVSVFPATLVKGG